MKTPQYGRGEGRPGAWRLGFASGVVAFAPLVVVIAYVISLVVSFSMLQSVMPGPVPLVLSGRGYVDTREVGDPYHSAHEWLVAIDAATGAARTFDISAAVAERSR